MLMLFSMLMTFPSKYPANDTETDRPVGQKHNLLSQRQKENTELEQLSSTDCRVNRDCVSLAGNTNMVEYLKNDETIRHIHTVSVCLPSAGI